jgi:peptide/nickel transport system ATP-binding protein
MKDISVSHNPDRPGWLGADNVCIGYRMNGTLYTLLNKIHFSLPAGETLGIIGESGAGKSLLLRTLANQLPDGFIHTGGTFAWYNSDGQTSRQLQAGVELTFIPQDPINALNPLYTIGRHFREQLARLGIGKKQANERAIAMLQEVNLADARELLARYPHQISGGMCQRIVIALAFITNPVLVVCDEATSALDNISQAHVIRLIQKIQRQTGTSVIFVTHNLAFVSRYCEKLLVMYGGEIVEQGVAKHILRRPAHPYTLALLQAQPQQHAGLRLQTLKGAPAALNILNSLSCRFSPRCHYCRPQCLINAMKTTCAGYDEATLSRQVRCHYPWPEPLKQTKPEAASIAATPHTSAVLQLKNIAKSYKNGDAFTSTAATALDNINFSVFPGEFIGITGISGSGKSTLAKVIAGIEAADCGSILLNQQAVGQSRQDKKRRTQAIQIILQDYNQALNPHRTVESLLTQRMEYSAADTQTRTLRARELLALLELDPVLLQRFPHQLSGGQRQRINIGRAICTMPQLLIADEITSGLDVSVQARILNLLRDLKARYGIALLFISHDLQIVHHLCDRVIVLDRGKIIETGDSEAIFRHPQTPFTRRLLQHSLWHKEN